MVCSECRAGCGLTRVGVEEGDRKGEQRANLRKGQSERPGFYSAWHGKSLKSFKEESDGI